MNINRHCIDLDISKYENICLSLSPIPSVLIYIN